MSVNIYVGNLPHEVSDSVLKDLFAQHGEVTGVRIITDKFTERPRGFAFVEMANPNEGQAAIEKLNGMELQGRTLKVSEARPRREKRNYGGGGRRPRGPGNFGSRNNRPRRNY